MLIDKATQNIISDQILKEYLDKYEREKFDIEAKLLEFIEPQIQYGKLTTHVIEFLKNPGIVWLEAPFDKKLQLQEFKFPKGLVYDGKNFATPEICSLLRTKSELFGNSETLVDYRLQNFEHLVQTNFSSPFPSLDCNQVGKEMGHLNDILCAQEN